MPVPAGKKMIKTVKTTENIGVPATLAVVWKRSKIIEKKIDSCPHV
jgi:hypothetical protein